MEARKTGSKLFPTHSNEKINEISSPKIKIFMDFQK